MTTTSARTTARFLRYSRRFASFAVLLVMVGVGSAAFAPSAKANSGGRFTILRDDGSEFGVTFAGAGYGEEPFVIDTDGNRSQEVAVYYNGRFTVRRDDGTYWGVTIPGGGMGEVPLAIDTDGDGRQEFAFYYRGRFTVRRDDGSLWGATMPGAGLGDIPLAVDTDGDRIQEFAVYNNGRFTFLRSDGSTWGVTFAGAGASDVPFVIDTNGDHKQELGVYNNGRMTVRRDDGSYWGINFPGAGMDDYPIAVDSNQDGRQEFAVYSHTVPQMFAKQIIDNPSIDKSGRLVQADLDATAAGQAASSGKTLSSVVLRNIVRLAHGHSIQISALESGGTGHSSGSYHYDGDAVDFSKLDGHALQGRDSYSATAINAIKGDLPAGSGFGQSGCGTTPTLPAGVTSFSDTCNHLHVQVPRGTN